MEHSIARRSSDPKRWLVVLATMLATAAPAAADRSDLEKARQLLEDGHLAEASKIYGTVSSNSSEFLDRLLDTARWHLLQNDAQESFRTLEIIRRLGLQEQVADFDYLRALAITRARGCALDLPIEKPEHKLLLRAHILRFPQRYYSRGYRADPSASARAGRHQTHLAGHQTHFLTDIPNLKILVGRGCRVGRSDLANQERSQTVEFETLKEWYEGYYADLAETHSAVALRLLELAIAKEDRALQSEILRQFNHRSADLWRKTPEPERTFVWGNLLRHELLLAGPYGREQAELRDLVINIILSNDQEDVAPWIALLKLEELSAEQQHALFSHLLRIETLPHRAYILYQKARLSAVRQEIQEALGTLQQLLMFGASEQDPEVQQASIELVVDIFREFRFDDTLLGAMQAAVPVGLWPQVFRPTLLDEALAGSRKGYAQIRTAALTAKRWRSLRLQSDEEAILEAMARRDTPAVRKHLQSWMRDNQLGAGRLRFIQDIANRAIGISPDERRRVQPLLNEFDRVAETFLARGQRQQELLALRHTLATVDNNRLTLGQTAPSFGGVVAGQVDLSRRMRIASPYVWETPARLPLRDLLLMPEKATNRAWQLR